MDIISEFLVKNIFLDIPLIVKEFVKIALRKVKKSWKNIAEKFGSKKNVRIFAAHLRNNGHSNDSSLTSLRKDNEVKLEIRI